MRSVRTLYVAALAALAISGWLLFRGIKAETSPSAAPLIAAAGFLAATAGWIFNNATTLRVKIREKSFEYLQKYTQGLLLAEAAATLTRLWDSEDMANITASEQELHEYWHKNFPSHELFKSLRSLANLYKRWQLPFDVTRWKNVCSVSFLPIL